MKTYIIGHKNPDTDTVVSAIALAECKNHTPAIANSVNKETAFVLERFGFETPRLISKEEKKVIIVDVNEPSQISEDIKNEEIIGVIDHHKLGGLTTVEPISIRIEPVGSTSTVIANIFNEEKITISQEIASILLAGIVSDTLNFHCPTTTDKDIETAKLLNKIADIDINELASEMFKAKSDLSGVSPKELVDSDYKMFDIKGKKVGMAVFETVDPAPALRKKDDILKVLIEKKKNESLDYLFFAVIDILKEIAYFVTASEEDKSLISKALNIKEEGGGLISPGTVSRKKQMIPAIEKAL